MKDELKSGEQKIFCPSLWVALPPLDAIPSANVNEASNEMRRVLADFRRKEYCLQWLQIFLLFDTKSVFSIQEYFTPDEL